MRMSKYSIVFAVILLGCATRKGFEKLSPLSEPTLIESVLGSQHANKLLSQFGEESDSEGCKSSRAVVSRLLTTVESSDVTFSITCLDAPKIMNASAASGNRLFIWSGVFQFVRNVDELAAILAHEFSHILAGHLKKESFSTIPSERFGFGKPIKDPRVVQDSRRENEEESISSRKTIYEREIEADEMGLILLSRAGFDPNGAIKMWRRLLATEGSNIERSSPRNHPGAAERLRRLEATLPRAIHEFQLSNN